MFNMERLLITSPKALGEVLTSKSYNFIKPRQLRAGLGRILGVGILLAEGDEHRVCLFPLGFDLSDEPLKTQRKNLMPAFNFRHIKDLYPIFWSKSRELVESLKNELNKKAPDNVVEIGDWASRATLDIIGVAGLGQDFGALKNPNTELNTTYRTIFAPSRAQQMLGLLSIIINPKIVQALPIKRNSDMVEAQRVIRSVSREIIRQKRAIMEKNEKRNVDIISVALESGGFTEENLVDQMMTFIAAGHETTSSTLTWAIYELCKNPEIQTRLREEIHANIDSLGDSMDAAKLDNLPYLHAVCNETLRHNAPVPLTLRDAENDCTIADVFVPKGTKIIICPWAVNFSKDLWGPDAAEFNPDRWMGSGRANTGGAESNYAMLTFLHGPRSCIGQNFAKGEFACLLAAFVGKFEFEMRDPNEKIEIKGGVTARPKNGMHIKLKVVEGW
jgi:cytochrome P450